MNLRQLLGHSQLQKYFLRSGIEQTFWQPADVRWATKLAAGHTSNKKDTPGGRMGVKKTHGQYVRPGMILARQQSFYWFAGWNVGMGHDRTIYSLIEGTVKFSWDQASGRLFLNVNPLEHSLLPQLPDTHAETEYVIGRLDPDFKKFMTPRKRKRRYIIRNKPLQRFGP
eukprot:TRINITY_DN9684_c2_g1_i2.p1 TRINITY_DN9684_c2_g1~~TRINITY_DN9684_c2_g1_i2.p1  ORF type:complete len:169 (-),score=10.68 TRINITY_DN9684_c2_g1_i2:343-849(-)